MDPRITPVDWPPPDTVSSATVMAGRRLAICYGFSVVTFPTWFAVKVSGPNDEALNGHPLYRYGLTHYSIHRVENSPWLNELERENSVHPRHSRDRYLSNKTHYLFALKEEVVECIVQSDMPPLVASFSTTAEAIQRAKEAIDA